MRLLQIFWLHIFLTILAPAAEAQPSYVKCEQNSFCNRSEVPSCCLISSTAVINNDDFTFFNWNYGMGKIFFEANEKIMFLPKFYDSRDQNVTAYIAKSCAIVEIFNENFSKLSNLITIDLSSNQITSFEVSVFDGLFSLENIFLGDNKIKTISSKTLDGTSSFLTVDLSGNICIDGVFSKQQLGEALTTKCAPESHVTSKDALFGWKCGNSVRQRFLRISGNLRGGNSGYWNFLAALFYKNPSLKSQFFCTSSVISEKHLLSAAHCFRPKTSNSILDPENIFAMLGQQHLSEYDDDMEHGYEYTEIEKVYIHEKWNSSEMKYGSDIAILLTKIEIPQYFGSTPVCLTKNSQINELDFGLVMGWGDGFEGPPYKGTMRAVPIRSVSAEDCFADDHLLGAIFARGMFCAGGEGIGPCQGASGGGFFVRVNRQWFLRGIVSSAMLLNGTCDFYRYGLYTRVSDYADWIKNIVDRTFEVLETTTNPPTTMNTQTTTETLDLVTAWHPFR